MSFSMFLSQRATAICRVPSLPNFASIVSCRGGPSLGAALGPADAVRNDVRRVAVLHDGRKLAVEPRVFDAVRLRDGSLRRFLFEAGLRQHVERLALVRPSRGLLGRLVEGNGVPVRSPGQHANVVPSFLEVDAVELRQRHRDVISGRLPGLRLARGTDRSRLLGDDLNRKVIEPPYLARMGVNLHYHADLSPVSRHQNLLPDEVGESFILMLFVGDDGKIGLDPGERDLFWRNFGREIPLVERQIPVLAVEDDVASPGNRILQPSIFKILGEPPLYPLVGEVKVQDAPEHRCVSLRQLPDATVVLAYPPVCSGRVVKEFEVRNQSDFVQGSAE